MKHTQPPNLRGVFEEEFSPMTRIFFDSHYPMVMILSTGLRLTMPFCRYRPAAPYLLGRPFLRNEWTPTYRYDCH
ncbi:hypothetical protein BDV29DRAFT_174366 [Aspergillus leporis]|uniref:Uncharacterized protein n=1 Tax=Aspergillus leporis TaxID=41062 RepID=A0A5N5X0D5_9EURO|nr:hypothetical protein BDV29DRAFT_174366 [Aspergillus leporis]